MKVYAKHQGEGAFWMDLDFDRSIALGMEYENRPYSGKWEHLPTEVYWPVNHMVSPKEKALKCVDCHTRGEGRLAKLQDFYLPGRDRSKVADFGGMSIIILSLIGVFTHMMLRIFRKNF